MCAIIKQILTGYLQSNDALAAAASSPHIIDFNVILSVKLYSIYIQIKKLS